MVSKIWIEVADVKLCFFRRYTRLFGDHGHASPAICAYSLARYRKWENEIDKWQSSVMTHP